jgi:type 1 glutamine amidotransferase
MRMKRICVALVLCVMVAAQLAHAAGKPIRVAILDGASAAAYHNWRLTTQVIKRELEETGLFEVTVLSAPPADGDFSNFKPEFGQYQAIVMNYDAQDWPADLRAQFERYVSGGGGLVVLHAADNAFPDWQAYNEMTGVGGWRKRNESAGPHWYWQDGKMVGDTSPGNAGQHGARLPFQVTVRDGNNPIVKGLPPVWMHANDELYAGLRGPGKNMTVLATAHSDDKNHGTGKEEPMLMVLRYGKGRIFHTPMGHDAFAMSCVGFATVLQRGTEWVATGKVTQKAPADFPTAKTVSYRVDWAEMDPEYLKGASELVMSEKK